MAIRKIEERLDIDAILTKVREAAYRDGYAAGKRDGRDEVLRTLVDKAFSSPPSTAFITQGVTEPPKLAHTRGKPPKIAREILAYVHLEPGKTGAEIAQANPKIAERTIRTSLRRLRLKTLIKQEDGKWFPVMTP